MNNETHVKIRRFSIAYCKVNTDQLRKGRSSNCCKLRDNSCFGILRGYFLKIDLVIRMKGEGNQFFGPKLDTKVLKLPKIHISQTAGQRKLVDPSK